MTEERLRKIKAYYTHYRQSLQGLRDRIKTNNEWYLGSQTEFGSNRVEGKASPESRTPHLFNAIQYKHASIMDNYPQINVLPREEGDTEEAKTLSGIMPFILENCDFKKTYSLNSYEKLKSGTAVYGVFYRESEDGEGEIVIEGIDLLRFAFQPGIENIQDSKYVFYDSFMDLDEFTAIYGERAAIKTQSTYDESQAGPEHDLLEDVVVITDCYYKVTGKDGKKVLHFVKFSGNEILDYTEGKEEYKNGLYQHSRYPFVFDILHPTPNELCGRGLIDYGKNTQSYIDKLDEIVNTSALLSAEPRYFIKESAGVNVDDFLNIRKKVVPCSSLSDDAVKEIKHETLPAFIINHRAQKIDELKEVLGNRDFSQGGTSGGVTAASAITALQNSGDKLDRDAINSSYDAFKDVVWLCIEIIREFFDEEKTYRILGEDGGFEYVAYSNKNLKEHPVAGGIEGFFEEEDVEEVAQLLDVPVAYEKPLFDITLSVEKNNPYQRAQHNELILALYNMGLFSPQQLDLGKFVLTNLNFDGKDKLIQQLDEMQQNQMQNMPAEAAVPAEQSAEEDMLSFPIEQGTGGTGEEMLSFPIGQ